MKKLALGITALLLVASVAVFANGGGKKKGKKAVRKNKTECCIKAACCDKKGCNTVAFDEKAKAEVVEETKTGDGCCSGQSICGTKEN